MQLCFTYFATYCGKLYRFVRFFTVFFKKSGQKVLCQVKRNQYLQRNIACKMNTSSVFRGDIEVFFFQPNAIIL